MAILSAIAQKLERRHLLFVTLAVAFYLLKRLPDVFAVGAYYRLIYPTFAVYAAQNILFPQGALNRELQDAVMSPANGVFIYPPGTYAIAWWLDSVRSLLWFSFAVQLFVPVLVFYLLRQVVSTLTAALFALIAVQYWTVIQPHPDYTVQPVMLLAVLLLYSPDVRERLGLAKLALAGVLTGVIVVLKHNVGVFFCFMAMTALLFDAVEARPRGRTDRWLLVILFAGYVGAGTLLAAKMTHLDDAVLYLLPYFVFSAVVWSGFRAAEAASIDWKRLARSSALFLTGALPLPAYVFWTLGDVVGYRRYWYALFEMGFTTIGAWDIGLTRIIRAYARQAWTLWASTAAGAVDRSTVVVFFLVPFVIAALACYSFWRSLSTRAVDVARFKRGGAIASVAVLAPLMLFPLEDYRILRTKVVVSIFAGLALAGHQFIRGVAARAAVAVVLLLVFAAGGLGVREGLRSSRADTAFVSGGWRAVIDVPLARAVAVELDEQAAVIERSVPEARFFLVHFGGLEMAPLLILSKGATPQYYIETREEFLDGETTAAIIAALQRHSHLVVRSADLRHYLEGRPPGAYSGAILDFVHKNFDIVDRYERPSEQSATFSGIADFYVMKRRMRSA